MSLFRRLPPRKLRPPLERAERVLAWARTVDGNAVVTVTTLGLWLPDRPRLGWHEIHKATWSGSRLTVVPAVRLGEPVTSPTPYSVMVDDAEVTVQLTDPGDVPAAVRARVTRSVAFTAHHGLPDGGVRVVARRVAGADGLVWHVRYDDGTDPASPGVAEETAALVADAAHPASAEDLL